MRVDSQVTRVWFTTPRSPAVIVPEREKTVRKPEEPPKQAQSNSRGFALLTLFVNSVTDSGPWAKCVETKRSIWQGHAARPGECSDRSQRLRRSVAHDSQGPGGHQPYRRWQVQGRAAGWMQRAVGCQGRSRFRRTKPNGNRAYLDVRSGFPRWLRCREGDERSQSRREEPRNTRKTRKGLPDSEAELLISHTSLCASTH